MKEGRGGRERRRGGRHRRGTAGRGMERRSDKGKKGDRVMEGIKDGGVEEGNERREE